MTTPHAERVLPGHRDRVGESPLWDPALRALWWVDIESNAIRQLVLGDAAPRSWTMPERVACLALHVDGGLVAGLETRLAHVAFGADGAFTLATLAPARHERPGMRFNDGRCDRAGRFWVGTMVRDMSANVDAGRMYRFDANGLAETGIANLYTPNGLAFDPDGRGMWWSDSHPLSQSIWHAPLAEDGTLGQRRLVLDMRDLPGRPDGAAMDVDGGYWICANDGGRILRLLPDGRIDRTLRLPVSKPAMCSFGGDALDTLFVTTIQPLQPQGDDIELAGEVFALRPGTQGLAETPFRPR